MESNEFRSGDTSTPGAFSKCHFVLSGGGGYHDQMARSSMSLSPPRPTEFDRYAIELADGLRPAVGLLATASGDNVLSQLWFYATVGQLGCEVSHFDLFRRSTRSIVEFIDEVEVLYVTGGNTKNLLLLWREHGVDEALLRRASTRPIVVVGYSAGALCWFEDGLSDSYGPPPRPLGDGLGALEGTFCPHFAQNVGRYKAAVEDGSLGAGYAVEDGAALHFHGRRLVRALSIGGSSY